MRWSSARTQHTWPSTRAASDLGLVDRWCVSPRRMTWMRISSQLRLDGTLCLVGLPEQPVQIAPFVIVTNRRSFAGSMIGGMSQTQEMLDYCAEKNIVSEIELIGYDRLAEAYDRVIKGDVKYRFVLDNTTLKQ